MKKQSFYRWIVDEVVTAKVTLLGLYEQRDRLLYVQAPSLRQEYMKKIGVVEEGVLEAELETAMMRRKLELVQIAYNRREPIDMVEIEAKLEQEKTERLKELEKEDVIFSELPQLSAQEEKELQQKYREIIEAFHPAVNSDITETQKELYTKAVQAYKNRDIQAMQLIYALLFPPTEMGEIKLSFCVTIGEKTEENIRGEYRKLASELSADYRLAKELYSCFKPLEEDVILQNKLNEYTDLRKALETEIAQIQVSFPFNAASTLKDPAKTEEYLEELRVRMRNAEEEKTALNAKIQILMEKCENG